MIAGASLIALAFVWMRDANSSADAATSGPKWGQVQYGIMKVASNWFIETRSSGSSDSCDMGAAYVAQTWARQEYLKEVGKFVAVYMSKQAILALVSKIWPLSWVADLLRDQIVRWLLDLAEDRFLERSEVRQHQRTVPADKINERTGENLPRGLEISDYFLIAYDRQARRVAILLTSDCGGPTSPLGPKPRVWEARYEVKENGFPIESNQSFAPVDIAAISPPLPNLDVHLRASPNPVLLGGDVTYVITVHNHGGLIAPDVEILDGMDLFTEHVEFGSANPSQGTCVVEPRAVGCQLGDLEPAAEGRVEIRGTVLLTAGNFLENHVWVDPDDGVHESDESDNYREVKTRVRRTSHAPDLAITKSGTPVPAEGDALGEIVYGLTVDNRGDVAAVNVQVRDVLPDATWLSSEPTTSQGTCSGFARRVDCELGTMAPGASVTVAITASVETCSGPLVNTATVDPADAIAEIDEHNNTAQETTPLDVFCPTPLEWAPWPMYQHDAQRSGRSPYVGPQGPDLKWEAPPEEPRQAFGSPVVAGDGTIYVGTVYSGLSPSGLHAVTEEGETAWLYESGWVRKSPALGPDGTVYLLAGGPNELAALNPDGTVKWRIKGASWANYEPVESAVGDDGTFYHITDCIVPSGEVHPSLIAVDPAGSATWFYDLSDRQTYPGTDCSFPGGGGGSTHSDAPFSSPALDDSGNIYFVNGDGVFSLSPDGADRWVVPLERECNGRCYLFMSPTGAIYAAVSGRSWPSPPTHLDWADVYALTPEGAVIWRYDQQAADVAWSRQPAVGADGTVYLVRWTYGFSSAVFSLVALDPDGTLRWSHVVSFGSVAAPVVGGDGTIYMWGQGTLRAYAPDGTIKWTGNASGTPGGVGLAIGPDGTLYVAGRKLYAFGPGPAPTPTPTAALPLP